MLGEHTSAEVILFFTLYGLTGAMALFAAVYLLLRRGGRFRHLLHLRAAAGTAEL